ncbi:hypothetical protein [Actomonas aquatica]|uniref:Uncharacterized protein n=1 Tax=Actomonas aquatica TaxID=2866162 RepID=A0ABZ1C9W2_9BACT|nr:hypothetical protein [Opitutus sp. WL0086]WRQ88384.1 hypothetical protein K1X11_003145 [Opitutus sp. WL0086]
MKALVNLVSILALVATAAAPVLYFNDSLSEASMRTTLVIAMVAWFVSAWWRDRQSAGS